MSYCPIIRGFHPRYEQPPAFSVLSLDYFTQGGGWLHISSFFGHFLQLTGVEPLFPVGPMIDLLLSPSHWIVLLLLIDLLRQSHVGQACEVPCEASPKGAKGGSLTVICKPALRTLMLMNFFLRCGDK